MVESGAVSSLTYPYCSKTPSTAISIKKYAGPVNTCNAAGIPNMGDTVYKVPANGNVVWAYCYAVSVPSNSEECLYDITLSDDPSSGGIGIVGVTTAGESLCPGGETRYFAGPTIVGQVVPFYIDATVEGYGYYSRFCCRNPCRIFRCSSPNQARDTYIASRSSCGGPSSANTWSCSSYRCTI